MALLSLRSEDSPVDVPADKDHFSKPGQEVLSPQHNPKGAGKYHLVVSLH